MSGDEVVIGARGGLRSVFERVAMVAPSDLPVLLLGETGVGKEVVSRIVHDGSNRCDGPFWRVNCGALPSELVDSELFGHERGSFTGAIAQRKGWFEQAHRGTLFLDEIAELPLAAQVRLLRVLQEGELVRVGGAQTTEVDVRIVAATHRDLPAMVEAGEFREDLYYRISAFPIVIPPLRERGADVAELAHHFAARAAQRFGLPPIDLELYDLELLQDYPWPGNVRELATVIDRAVLIGEGRRIDIARALNLSPRVATRFGDPRTRWPERPRLATVRGDDDGHDHDRDHDELARARSSRGAERSSRSVEPTPGRAPVPAMPPPARAPLRDQRASAVSAPDDEAPATAAPDDDAIEPLDDVIRRHIERALASCQGRIDGPFGAARKLAINPHTLRARMRKLGVDWHRHRRR